MGIFHGLQVGDNTDTMTVWWKCQNVSWLTNGWLTSGWQHLAPWLCDGNVRTFHGLLMGENICHHDWVMGMSEFSMAYKLVTTSDTMTYKWNVRIFCGLLMGDPWLCDGDVQYWWLITFMDIRCSVACNGESGLFGQCFGCLLVYI